MYIFVRGFSGAYKFIIEGAYIRRGLIIIMETLFVFLNVQL